MRCSSGNAFRPLPRHLHRDPGHMSCSAAQGWRLRRPITCRPLDLTRTVFPSRIADSFHERIGLDSRAVGLGLGLLVLFHHSSLVVVGYPMRLPSHGLPTMVIEPKWGHLRIRSPSDGSHCKRFSLLGSGASWTSSTVTPCPQSGGQIAT